MRLDSIKGILALAVGMLVFFVVLMVALQLIIILLPIVAIAIIIALIIAFASKKKRGNFVDIRIGKY